MIVCLQFVGKSPHSCVNNNRTLLGEPILDSVCYQISYSVGFEYVYIKLGLTSSIEYHEKHMMNL